MRLSDLRDAKVRTLDGKLLGRVHEVHADKGRVIALTCGPGSWIERMTARNHGRRVPWECVVRLTREAVIITSGPPQRIGKDKPNASRSRQGTRRPSARRSKR